MHFECLTLFLNVRRIIALGFFTLIIFVGRCELLSETAYEGKRNEYLGVKAYKGHSDKC